MTSLIGQSSILSILKESVRRSTLSTSLLLSGPSGSGKKTLARLIARGLNCQNGRFAEDCSCNACHKIETGIHPDVRWIGMDEEAYSIKIEEIHQLINWAGLKVLEGKTKVFILNRVERLTDDAANALLKTLEEPPASSCLILLVENQTNLVETLLSRCFKIKMRPIPREELRRVLVSEHGWNEKEADLAAAYSQGRLGRALELKEEKIPEIRKTFLESVLAEPTAGLEKWAGKKRHEVLNALEIFSFLVRDLLVYKETGDETLLYQGDPDRFLKEWSGRLDPQDLLDMLDLINETENALRENVNPKLALFHLGTSLERICRR